MADISVLNFGDGVNRDIKDVTSRVLLPATVGWTGKNEFINRGASITTNNITVTINSDKSITVSTTEEGASANTGVNINAYNQIYLKRGTYIWSSAHDSDDSIGSNVTNNMVYTYLYDVNGGSAWIPSSEPLTSRILNITDETKPIYCKLYVGSGTKITTPITFYPMIRDSRITDPTYEPYHKSVEECLEENVRWDDVSGDVQKNLLKNAAITQTINGITITVNADKSVRLAGTSTGEVSLLFQNAAILPVGEYIYTCGDTDKQTVGGASFSVYIKGINGTTNWIAAYLSKADRTLNITRESTITMGIYVANGRTIDTTFKPMIRKTSVLDSAYVPYVPSNSELDTRLSTAEGSISTLENQVAQNTYTFVFVTKNEPFSAVDTYETIASFTLPAGTWHIIATHGQVGDIVSGARIAIGANVYGVNEQVAKNITVETIIKLGATSTTIELQGKISAKGSGGNSMRYLYRKVAS